MATEYTRNFRLAKPDFRTSPWSSQLNENAERTDALIYNALQAHGIIVYDNDVLVPIGQIMYDPDLNTFWVNTIEHTTKVIGDFASERADNPGAWVVLQFAWTPRGQWTHSTIYNYYDIAYDPSVGLTGVCVVPHSTPATGTMEDEIDKWIIIADAHGISSALIAFDNTGTNLTSTNVQNAIAELDDNAVQKAFNLSDLPDKAAARVALDMAAFGTSGLYLGTGYDLNTLTKNGFYIGQEFVNGPAPTIWFYIQHETLGPVGPTYHFQRAVGLDGTVYKRSCQGGTWSTWTLVVAQSTVPTYQSLTASSGTYVPTSPLVKWIEVDMVGGGGGGGGAGTVAGTQPQGGAATTFNGIAASGGGAGNNDNGGNNGRGGAPGSGGSGTAAYRKPGGNGANGSVFFGGAGGDSFFGGSGAVGSNSVGGAGPANTGAGGCGASVFSNQSCGGGGGAGEHVHLILPAGTYSYTIGAGGDGGTGGTNNGGKGGSGFIFVVEHY